MRKIHCGIAVAVALAVAGPAMAGDAMTWTVEDTFENVAFAIESEIVGRGFVVDHLSHVGEMLERTKADVGATKTIFTQADVYSFCSATVSRAVMEIDPLNIVHCPYGIFIYETPEAEGKITVGFTDYPEGSMQQVEDLLTDIVKTALGL